MVSSIFLFDIETSAAVKRISNRTDQSAKCTPVEQPGSSP